VSLMFRIVVFVPVLYLIAIVVVGQQHSTAQATLRAAWPRTLRWLWMSLQLVAIMIGLELLFIGW
jgi:hypothetical protein